ncbi:methyl-accepting chemotaxis sensory transducer, partial [human gut metagenome]
MLFAGAPASDVNSFIAVKTGTLVGVAIVIGILAFIVIIIRVLAIRNGLNDANGALGQLACGNLNVQMSKRLLKRKDELGSMAKSLQLLQNELRNIIEKIQSASNDVLTAGVQLGDMSAQTSENASEIGNAVDDIASGAVAQAEE